MNYKIKIEDIVAQHNVAVIETATDQVIKKFETVEAAKKFMRHLNLGGAFDGWSPSFILKSVVK
jgi:hypothetical protein